MLNIKLLKVPLCEPVIPSVYADPPLLTRNFKRMTTSSSINKTISLTSYQVNIRILLCSVLSWSSKCIATSISTNTPSCLNISECSSCYTSQSRTITGWCKIISSCSSSRNCGSIRFNNSVDSSNNWIGFSIRS